MRGGAGKKEAERSLSVTPSTTPSGMLFGTAQRSVLSEELSFSS